MCDQTDAFYRRLKLPPGWEVIHPPVRGYVEMDGGWWECARDASRMWRLTHKFGASFCVRFIITNYGEPEHQFPTPEAAIAYWELTRTN